jgi:hypothetical protein
LRVLSKPPIKRETGYLPHFFNDWFIKAGDEVLPSAKTWQEAVTRANRIAEENPGAKIKIYPRMTDIFEATGEKYNPVLGDIDYMITQANISKTFEMDLTQAGEIMDNMFNMYPRKRFLGQLLDRVGAEGWVEDVGYMTQHYGNVVGRYIAIDKFKKAVREQSEMEGWHLESADSGIQKYIRDYVNDINGVPTELETYLSQFSIFGKKGSIGRFLEGDRPLQRLASKATSTMAITKLGLYNVSAAVVNSSQIMNTFAVLGREYTKLGLEKASLFDKGKMSARDRGIVKKLQIEEQMGLEHDTLTGNPHDAGRMLQSTTQWFQKIEQFNRRTAGLGAYYKFLADHPIAEYGLIKDAAVKQHNAALEYAAKVIEDTQFDYSVYDSPGVIRKGGPVTAVLAQFKKFPIKQLEFILNLKNAEKPRFWIPYGLVVGVIGLPGAKAFIDSIEKATGINPVMEAQKHLAEWVDNAEDDFQKRVRVQSARMIMYGVPSLAGINLSARVGISDLFPQNFYDLMGPTVTTAHRTFMGENNIFSEKHRGDWAKILKTIATSPGNVAIAMQGTTYGKRGRKILDLTLQERLAKGLGFYTMRETEQINAQNMIRYDDRSLKAGRAKVVDKVIKGMESADQDMINKAVVDYREKNLGSKDSLKSAVRKEMGQRNLTATQRQFFNQSRLGKSRNMPVYKNIEMEKNMEME